MRFISIISIETKELLLSDILTNDIFRLTAV